jgi:hypothetical protein
MLPGHWRELDLISKRLRNFGVDQICVEIFFLFRDKVVVGMSLFWGLFGGAGHNCT